MKKLMMLLLSLVSAAGFVAVANGAPVCPSLSAVVNVNFDEASHWNADWGYVAWYDGTLSLGTNSKWYVAVKNLNVQNIVAEEGDQSDKILAQAQYMKNLIDIQVNQVAESDSYNMYPLHVCHYKSSNPSVTADLVAVQFASLLGGDAAMMPDMDPAFMNQLTK